MDSRQPLCGFGDDEGKESVRSSRNDGKSVKRKSRLHSPLPDPPREGEGKRRKRAREGEEKTRVLE